MSRRISELLSNAESARSPRLRALANLLRSERDPRVASCLAEALALALNVDARPSDPIARAIRLVEGDLARAWSVERLAKTVGLSRAAFTRRFRATTGHPPERYWVELRMRRAAELLRSSDQGLAAIAAEIGYGSEFAFGRAFKRWSGVAPGGYRKQSAATVVCLAA
jgi:transcriptional regulator GlxA family with amidase domain